MPTPTAPPLDSDRIEAFTGQLFTLFTGGMLTYMIDIGHRTGLFEAAAQGPGTSAELAERAGLQERYVREWAGALTTGGVLDYASETGTYTLPPEHAVCLTGSTSMNLAPTSLASALLARNLPLVADAFRRGGGVPYDAFRPEFTSVMDGLSRGLFDEMLISEVLPLADGLLARLAEGARAADVGCGTGHAVNLMAAAHPGSQFVGYDLAPDAIAAGREEAAQMGLRNVAFEVVDVTDLPARPPFDVIFAFDAIHDQAQPAAVLNAVHDALAPDGLFVMMDVKVATRLEDNIGNPLAPWIYAVSTLHCMTVSLAEGGAGLGTAWGRELAEAMLVDAGFRAVAVHDVPGDPFDLLYVCRA